MKTDFFFSLHRLSSEVVCIKCWLVPRQHLFICCETGRKQREIYFSVIWERLRCCICSSTGFPLLPFLPTSSVLVQRGLEAVGIIWSMGLSEQGLGGKHMLTFFSDLYRLWQKFLPNQTDDLRVMFVPGWCVCRIQRTVLKKNIYPFCTSESTSVPQRPSLFC